MSSYSKIVVGTDGSDTSLRAVEKAGQIAHDSDADLLIVMAYRPADAHTVNEATDALKQDAYLAVGSAPAEGILREAASRARAKGASKVHTLAVREDAVEVLDKTVLSSGADMLVVGNVGLNSLQGRLLGSVPQSVARHAGVDVLIAHTAA